MHWTRQLRTVKKTLKNICLLQSTSNLAKLAQEISICHLAGWLLVPSHPSCVPEQDTEPQLPLTRWLLPCMAASRRWCEWVN